MNKETRVREILEGLIGLFHGSSDTDIKIDQAITKLQALYKPEQEAVKIIIDQNLAAELIMDPNWSKERYREIRNRLAKAIAEGDIIK